MDGETRQRGEPGEHIMQSVLSDSASVPVGIGYRVTVEARPGSIRR